MLFLKLIKGFIFYILVTIDNQADMTKLTLYFGHVNCLSYWEHNI